MPITAAFLFMSLVSFVSTVSLMTGAVPNTNMTNMSSTRTADLILLNGNIYTVEPSTPRAEAVAVRDGRIIFVGGNAGALALGGPATRKIDLGGATVVPGLTDAHGHVSGLGFLATRLDLVGTGSAADVARMVAARAATLKPGQWIRGRGWDQNDWKQTAFPTSKTLDAASPANPVSLGRIDGHALWVNSLALKLAGVTRNTPDPAGGQIIHDASGEPTGVLVDRAESLVDSKIPEPTREETRDALKAGMQRCLEGGLTCVHDAGVDAAELDLYRELLVSGDFPFRIYAMLAGESAPVEGRPMTGWLEARLDKGPELGLGNGRLTVRAVKLYMDGALGSRGAALLAPYQDDPNNVGLLRMDPGQMRATAERSARAGFQVCIHAIGDRGNRLALDVLEAARKAGGSSEQRHRIEHAQVLSEDDLPRFARLGVIASMQPTHATSDMYWAADRIGQQRVTGTYAWRSLLSSGARLACGSDFPVESEKPLLGFYAAVTRQDAKGWPEGGWFPAQKLTREEALRCFTLDAAYAAFEENQRGSIVAGKRADLTVLTQDIMQVPAPEILKTSVKMTIVGGRIAFELK